LNASLDEDVSEAGIDDLNGIVRGETQDRPEMKAQYLKREVVPHLACSHNVLNHLGKDDFRPTIELQ